MLTIILPTHTAPIFEYDKHKLKVKGKLDTTWGDQKVDVLRYLNFFRRARLCACIAWLVDLRIETPQL